MDDRELKEAFEGYLDGVQPPPESVTERAKNQIRGQRARTKLIKRISVAAACVACACLVTLGIVFSPIIGIGGNKANGSDGWGGSSGMGDMNGAPAPSRPDSSGDSSPDDGASGDDNANSDDESSAPGTGGDESYKLNYYPQSELTSSPLQPDGIEGLEFIERALNASNFTVGDITGYYSEPTLMYAQTEITATIDGAEYQATVCAEFSDSDYACDIFKSYYDGIKDYYKGKYCLITSSQQGDEWVTKVFMKTGDVKYYVEVSSSDKNAYTAYLDLILGE